MSRTSLMSQASTFALSLPCFAATEPTGVVLQSQLKQEDKTDADKPEADTTSKIKATAGLIEARAAAIGEKLAANPVFDQELGAFADRKEENAVSAIMLCIQIIDTLDPQAIMSAPEHNSEQSHTDEKTGKVVVNNNPDKFTTIDQETGKKTPSSWYKVGALCTTAGKQVLNDIRLVRMAAKGEPSPVVDGKAQPNPYAGMGEPELEAYQRTLTTRIGNLRRAYVDAFKVAKQMVAVSAIGDGKAVSVDIERDPNDDNHVMPHLGSPIVVQDESKTQGAKRRHRYFSVTSFLALDVSKVTPDKVAQYGGVWQALVNSGARAPKGSGDKNKTGAGAATAKYPAIQTPDDFEDCAAEVAAFIDNRTDAGRKHIAGLLQVAAAKGADGMGDDMILTIGDIVMGLDPIWHLIEDRYNILNAKAVAERKDQPVTVAA